METHGSGRDVLVAWLKDAYAMEKGLVSTLESHAKDASGHPEVRARIEKHAQETRMHAQLVERCLAQLGEEPSTLKNVVGRVAGTMQGVATGAFEDSQVKNALSDYAVEHFEIAAYRALIEGARAIGQDQIVETCQQILREEEAMARFLESNLPTTVRDALMQAA
jgi:ferritin-like metal-binding protein YciE